MAPEAAPVQDDQFPGLPRSPVLELRNRRLRRPEVWHLRTSLRCGSCGRKPVRLQQRWRFGRRRNRWPTSTVCTRVQRQRYKRPSEASPVQLTRAGRVLEQAIFVYLSTRELVARVRVKAKLLH